MVDAIHSAAFDGDLEEVMRLVEENPEVVNLADEDGDTPLHQGR